MKELPYLEDIYDLETFQLEDLLHQLLTEANKQPEEVELPRGVDSYEKFLRKISKLQDCIELELEERSQVDNVINFFSETSKNPALLDDEQFYKGFLEAKNQKPAFVKQEEKLMDEIDPGRVLDDVESDLQSNFSQAPAVNQTSTATDSQSNLGFNKGKMNKKDLAAFMKAKLAQTKVGSQMTTNKSATGPAKQNFVKPKPPPVPQVQKPRVAPVSQPEVQQQQLESQVLSEEDEIAKAAAQMNKGLQRQYGDMAVNKKRRTEEHRVVNTSKNIYKPCFNMPAKETPKPQEQKKKEGPPRRTQQEVKEAPKQRAQSRGKAMARSDSKSKLPTRPMSKQSQFSKPQLLKTSSSMSRTARQTTEETKMVESESDQVDPKGFEASQSEQETAKEEEIVSVYHEDEESKQNQNQVKSQEIPSQDQQLQQQPECLVQDLSSFKYGEKKEELIDQVEQTENRSVNNDEIDEDQAEQNQNLKPKENTNEDNELKSDDSHEDEQVKEIVQQDETEDHQKESFIEEQRQDIEQNDQIEENQEEDEQVQSDGSESFYANEASTIKNPIVHQVEPESQLQALEQIKVTEQAGKTESNIARLKRECQERQQQRKDEENLSSNSSQNSLKHEEAPKTKLVSEVFSTAPSKEQPTKAEKPEIQVEQKAKDSQKESGKPSAQKEKPKKKPIVKKEEPDYLDYSHLYSSFFDIFVGYQIDPKQFDHNYCMRENRNVYASFVNLMQGNVQMQNKFKFDLNPLEKAKRDAHNTNFGQVPDHFTMIGKQVNELENAIKQRDQELLMQAQSQMALRARFQQQKNKDQSQILKEALAGPSAIEKLIDFDRKSSLFYRVIKNKSEVYDIITRSFARKTRWQELPHGLDLRNTWNLLWSWSKIKSDLQKLLVFQRANHFVGAKNVSRKDFLKSNIERARKISAKANREFNIMPLTYILPKEYVDFLTIFSDLEDKEGKMNYWIMKPSASSRGRGIQLVNEISQITYGEPMVVQRYIKNPLLLNGYKFDLRIYVLVTSVNPLEAFIYKEGFGRFSTAPFTLDPSDKANRYIHLTNYSINKNNLKNYDVDKKDRQFGGTKVSLGTLRKTFTEDLKIDWDTQIWEQIRSTCVKALVAAQNDIQYNPCCFDLYGFDVIFDEDLKCWLLEINSSPSLACDTLLDDMIKQRLIDDTIDLINPLDFDRKRLVEVIERRIQEEQMNAGGQIKQISQKKQMNRDLTYILNGQMPRGYGETPQQLGNYEMLAPTVQTDDLMKLIGGQKMFGSTTKISERIKLDGVKGIGSLPKVGEKKEDITPKQPRRTQPSQAVK